MALLLRTGSAIIVFRLGTTDGQRNHCLSARHSFWLGTRAAAVKGGWHQAKLGAVKTDADWTYPIRGGGSGLQS